MSAKNSTKIYDNVIIFTDGSCIKSGNEQYCGYGVYFPNNESSNIARALKNPPYTNNRAELHAIQKALKRLKKINFNTAIIYSDSEYSIKSVTVWIKTWKQNNWMNAKKKPVENQDYIKKIDKLLSHFGDKVSFKHVRAHTGGKDFLSVCNDAVDGLAKQGAMRMMKKI